MPVLGINAGTLEAGLTLLSLSQEDTRSCAAALAMSVNANRARSLPVAYQPSLLRRYPVIKSGTDQTMLRCPLPEIIIQRVTAGIYYDLINGPSALRNEASDRFEQYSHELISKMLPSLKIGRSLKYKLSGNSIDTPDILIKIDNVVNLIVECKATKLSIGAQFAEDPLDEAEKGYLEIAKGVFQIWRFVSHARRAIISNISVAPSASGMVLTLDNWLVMSDNLQKRVIEKASEIANLDHNIIPEDRRHVVFCYISDLESTLAFSDEDSFLDTISSASEERFSGWILSSINEKLAKYQGAKKPFPFELGAVLPWWAATETLREERRVALALGAL